jgi:hypothetical protein
MVPGVTPYFFANSIIRLLFSGAGAKSVCIADGEIDT